MTLSRRLGIPGLIPLLLIVGLLLTSVTQAAPPAPPSGDRATAPMPERALSAPLASPSPQMADGSKLDSSMLAVAEAARASSSKVALVAENQRVPASGGRLQVYVTALPGQSASVAGAIRAAGGEVTKTGNEETLLQAWLPADKLEQVATDPGVVSLASPTSGSPAAADAVVSLVVNGSFEQPTANYPGSLFSAGQAFGGWTVESGSIDLVGSYWQAASGFQSVDLSGIEAGTMYQDVPTTVGQAYLVRFAMAGNPGSGSPSTKQMEVSWGTSVVDSPTFSTVGLSEQNMGWEYHQYVVVATASSTRLRFKSLTPGVWGIALDDVSVTLASEGPPTYTTEGVTLSGADAWQAAGYRGAGTKVAIIDWGFAGYTSRLGTELPATVVAKNFVDFETDDQVGSGTNPHGVACAEVVHDMAPDAQLYLIKISTSLDLREATTWLGTQGVDVVSYSGVWFNAGPGDGTGLVSSLPSQARDSGIIWVNAAGDYRQMHWGGAFSDPNSNRWHNFHGTWEVNVLAPGDHVNWYLWQAGSRIRVFLRWNDWTAVNQDYNLYLFRYNEPTDSWVQVAQSTNVQNGTAGQTPTESIIYTTTLADQAYAVAVYAKSVTRSANLELLVPESELDYQVTARSIASPADSLNAVTVGAVKVASPYNQFIYSSEGPSNGPGGAATGGSIKPDVAGYAGVTTATYGAPDRFVGTWAATPHVAGAAALVAGAFPSYSPDQVRAFLTSRAIDLGTAGKDNQFGAGRLNLGTPPPTIAGFGPPSGEVGSSVTITGTLFTGATAVTFNGTPATGFTVDSDTQITATVPTGASTGLISVTTPAGTATSANAYLVSEGGLVPQVILLPQPVRIVDTRSNLPYQASGLSLNGYTQHRRFVVVGYGGVPSNATAVLVNLTAVGYKADGWLSAYPACTTLPTTSNVNFDLQENAIANFAIVKLGVAGSGPGCQGAIDVTGATGTNAIVDVTGYLVEVPAPQSQVVLLDSPQRVVDTRSGLPYQGSGKPLTGYTQHSRFKMVGNANVPSNATAVLVNLTAVGYKADGWLSAYPACTTLPATSNVNFDTVENAIAGFAIVRLGSASADPTCQGAIDVTGASGTNVIVDVTGYLVEVTSPQIVLLDSPQRLVDTRPGLSYQGSGTKLSGNPSLPTSYLMANQGGVPASAKGVIANLTAVGYTKDGWIAAYPTGGSIPVTSSVNFDPDENAIANTAVLRLGTAGTASGKVSLVAYQPTNAIIDVSAYLVR